MDITPGFSIKKPSLSTRNVQQFSLSTRNVQQLKKTSFQNDKPSFLIENSSFSNYWKSLFLDRKTKFFNAQRQIIRKTWFINWKTLFIILKNLFFFFNYCFFNAQCPIIRLCPIFRLKNLVYHFEKLGFRITGHYTIINLVFRSKSFF